MSTVPINIRRVLVTIGIVILVFVVLEFNRRLEELKLLNDQAKLVRVQATQVMQTQLALETNIAYANSTAYVEEWARTDGHYVRDGDLPVVPVGAPGAAPIEISTPIPIPTPMQNWEVWANLFFGEE
jgi:cell division protein FtsB